VTGVAAECGCSTREALRFDSERESGRCAECGGTWAPVHASGAEAVAACACGHAIEDHLCDENEVNRDE
jgi:hypothetical protein